MIKIALCEDDAMQRSALQARVEEYVEQTDALDAQVVTFSAPEELEQYVLMRGGFSLYLLDIVMPGMSGIELGRRVRVLDADACIIYLTSSPDFALESYRVRAFHYLLKPVEKKELFATLDEALQALRKTQETSLAVKTKDGLVRVPHHALLYAELVGRAVHYVLQDGSVVRGVTLRTPFREAMEPLLEEPRFVLTSASFVVNLQYVQTVERGTLMLPDGKRVPLARALHTAVKCRWLDYWLEGKANDF